MKYYLITWCIALIGLSPQIERYTDEFNRTVPITTYVPDTLYECGNYRIFMDADSAMEFYEKAKQVECDSEDPVYYHDYSGDNGCLINIRFDVFDPDSIYNYQRSRMFENILKTEP